MWLYLQIGWVCANLFRTSSIGIILKVPLEVMHSVWDYPKTEMAHFRYIIRQGMKLYAYVIW